MPEMKIENHQLEELLEVFAKDRQKESYAKVMELLEKSVILVPILPPQNLGQETMEMMKEGKPVQLSKDAKIAPCLLRKESGEQMLPIYSSDAQIPQDKKSPALLTMPFWNCLAMVTANREKIAGIVLNPFTHNMVLPWSILEVAQKRKEALQGKTLRVTEKQFQSLAHNQVMMALLPKYLYEEKEEGLRKLQKEAGAFLLSFYEKIYPKEKKVPYGEDDFSVMTLNVTEQMQLTRVDMPDGAAGQGMCYRVYAVWKHEKQELLYYTLEKREQGNFFGIISAEGKHELLEQVPDNGAEIEAVMSLA